MSVNKTRYLKILVVAIILLIGLVAYDTERFGYVTFPLLPPLIAITLSMITGQVLPSLFLGVWIAALMYTAYNPIAGFMKTFEWIVGNITDSWNATILLFDFVIGAFVGVLYVSGAMHSIAEVLIRKVKSSRGASLIASILGVLVFFDDYSNTVIVGNTMRTLTDKLRVSRELLSYIVDSTAAPVAGIMFVSTWIGMEVSTINDALETIQDKVGEGVISIAPDVSAYGLWLRGLPYHFYSFLALLLVFLVVITRRHFGPMLEAELRAVKTGKVLRDGAVPLMPTETIIGEPKTEKRAPWWLFVISVFALITVTLIGLWYTGGQALVEEGVISEWYQASLLDAISNADPSTPLLWGSFTAYLVALIGALGTKALRFKEAMDATIKGFYLMTLANAILLLAWSIKTAVSEVGTADYIIARTVTMIPVYWIPLVVFLVSMFIAYTTGTSWGTFGIMMPLAVPLAWIAALVQTGSVELAYIVTAASIGAVFGGGIYGDHVSPISDTTIMSSMFSGCDHIDHVKTQIPYGTLAALVSLILYIILAIWLSIAPNPYAGVILVFIGVVVLIVLHRLLNKWYAKKKGLPEVVEDYRIE